MTATLNKNTWTENLQYKQSFFTRLEYLFSCLDLSKINSIMDLGCGNQWASKLIPENIKYIPVDVYKHRPTTITADFNKGEFYKKHTDLALCSGIIEYIYDVESFIKNIASCMNYVVCSYHFKEITTKRSVIWVNNMTAGELVKIFEDNDFVLEVPIVHTEYHDGESYCFFKKRNFPNITKAGVFD